MKISTVYSKSEIQYWEKQFIKGSFNKLENESKQQDFHGTKKGGIGLEKTKAA